MTLTRRKNIYVMAESSFATDPDSDGSDYLEIPAMEISDLSDGLEILDTDYMTKRPYPTAPIPGRDGFEFSITVPMIGLPFYGADGGGAPATTDWFDTLLEHVWGTRRNLEGEGGTGGSTSSVTLDSDAFSLQDLLPLYQGDFARTEWVVTTSDAGSGTYSIAPTIDGTPSGSIIAYGSKNYRLNPEDSGTLAFAYCADDVLYTLLGCRCTSATMSAGQVGAIWTMNLTFQGDSMTVGDTKASLPASATIIDPTPCKALLSPVHFNDTELSSISSIEIDLGIQAGEISSTAGTQGRSGMELRGAEPTVTVTPLFSSTNQNYKRNGTTGRLMVQMGAGILTGGNLLNTCALHAEEAIATEVTMQDDNGKQRQSIQFRITDKVRVAAGVDSVFMQFSRA